MAERNVKSGERVVEILELFARERRSLTASEICGYLGYPRSSANVLLHTLVNLNLLALRSESMRYFPTLRVAQLGDWLPSKLFGGDAVSTVVQELHTLTKETTTLTIPNGVHMEFVRVHVGTFPIALNIAVGRLIPMFGTGVGTAYLSSCSDDAVERLFARASEENVFTNSRMQLNEAMADVRIARKTGYAVAYDTLLSDTGAIAIPVSSGRDERTIVLGVGGLSSRIARSEPEIVKTMRSLARRVIASSSA